MWPSGHRARFHGVILSCLWASFKGAINDIRIKYVSCSIHTYIHTVIWNSWIFSWFYYWPQNRLPFLAATEDQIVLIWGHSTGKRVFILGQCLSNICTFIISLHKNIPFLCSMNAIYIYLWERIVYSSATQYIMQHKKIFMIYY